MKDKIENLFKKYKVKSISCDSRDLKPKGAFFAIRGSKFDGNNFINEALKIGGIAFTDNLKRKGKKVFYIRNVRLALAIGAAIIYPSVPINLVAVTGTNGKTSVVSYIYQIIKLLGQEVANLGSMGINSTIKLDKNFINDLPESLTTPDAITFRKILNALVNIGINNVIFEASSHGIDQYRLGNLKMKTVGFTSFSQDHLDYHKTMHSYLKTKLRLLKKNLKKGGELVINSAIMHSKYGQFIRKFLTKHKIRYFMVGIDGDIKVEQINTSLNGTSVSFKYNRNYYSFTTNIIGSFQAINLLIAARITENLGLSFSHIVKALEKIIGVAGRLQRMDCIESKFNIFIDYAHTPDALEKSLSELRNIKLWKNGNLYVIFGCGGERDVSKRVLMGQVACKLADYVIVTDDNPRNEDPQKIRLDILKGAVNAKEIEGRELAIESTVAKLTKDDILLISGKGNEPYQDGKYKNLTDLEVTKKIISEINKTRQIYDLDIKATY